MRPKAFTLLELLVVMTIIAILATALLGGLHSAREATREHVTRVVVATADQAVRRVWDQTWTQRLPVATPRGMTPQEQAKWRGNLRRELAQIAMPDRWSDLDHDPRWLPADADYRSLRQYRQPYEQAKARLEASGLNWEQAKARLDSHASAECLYMIVTAELSNRDQPSDIQMRWIKGKSGDKDKDGLPEIHDGWGNPVAFLRWPAGYPGSAPAWPISSPVGMLPQTITDVAHPHNGELYPAPGSAEEMGPRPLVYSAGPDRQYDVNRGVQTSILGGMETYAYKPDEYDNLNAWSLDENSPPHRIGEPLDSVSLDGEPADGSEGWLDNVTSQNYGGR